MTILHIGKYADPDLVGSNRLLSEQVFGLHDRGYSVEVLTWPQGDGWTREMPVRESDRRSGQPYLGLSIGGVAYHVIDPPRAWGQRWITDQDHRAAVTYAKALLAELSPEAVHFHYWHCLWWFLDAAIELGIPTLYTAYDYGLACAQTTLVMGDRRLCDATATIEKCAACTKIHPSLKGKLNEFILDLPGGGTLIRRLTGPGGVGPLSRVKAMRLSVRDRVRQAIERSRRILPQLNGVVVTTPFAARFFEQFGVPAEQFELLPWFYSQRSLNAGPAPFRSGDEIVLAYVGRLSFEKGVHLLLEALEGLETAQAVRLKLTGIPKSDYARDLQARYPEKAGSCRVEWAGWVDNRDLPDFYSEVHAAVFPSTWYDNCPTTLIEALAHRKFILCSDVPTMADFVAPERNALLFKRGDASDLRRQLRRFVEEPETYLRPAREHDSGVRSREAYLDELERIYRKRLIAG